MEILSEPWPWYVAGPLIAVVMVLLLYFGGNLGVSANLRTMCSMLGADKHADFFKIKWKSYTWNLVFILGAALGGFLAVHFLKSDTPIQLTAQTLDGLHELGFDTPEDELLPKEIFGNKPLNSFKGLAILILGGFMVGFGARYAGGCTSGHAISGLSNLQIPSLIAVVGFFIGGLLMVHLFYPLFFN